MSDMRMVAVVVAAVALSFSGMAREAIVFVGAHPDDTEGFAATAFLLRDKYDLHVVDLTRGERGLGAKGLADGSTGRIRVREEQEACRLLGATPHFLCEVNGRCHASAQAAAELTALLKEIRPKAVFSHWPVDKHSDHVQCAATVAFSLDELWVSENWRPQFYFYEVLPGQTRNWSPIYSVDVTKTMDLKSAMLRKYACQNPDDSLVRAKVAQAERRGRERDPPCRYAETYTTFDGKPIKGGVLEELPETAILKRGCRWCAKQSSAELTE